MEIREKMECNQWKIQIQWLGIKAQTMAMHILSSLLSVSTEKLSADDCPRRPEPALLKLKVFPSF